MPRAARPSRPSKTLPGAAALLAAFTAFTVLAGFGFWARAGYAQPEAVHSARAYAASPAGLAASGCPAQELDATGVHPPQTNGNRLRRWITGVEVEMPQLNVRLEGRAGPCLLTVTLRHGPDGWRVRRLQRTAG